MPRVYVGNLPVDIRESELDDLFYKYGRIREIDIKRPPRPPAFAFITYDDLRGKFFATSLNECLHERWETDLFCFLLHLLTCCGFANAQMPKMPYMHVMVTISTVAVFVVNYPKIPVVDLVVVVDTMIEDVVDVMMDLINEVEVVVVVVVVVNEPNLVSWSPIYHDPRVGKISRISSARLGMSSTRMSTTTLVMELSNFPIEKTWKRPLTNWTIRNSKTDMMQVSNHDGEMEFTIMD